MSSVMLALHLLDWASRMRGGRQKMASDVGSGIFAKVFGGMFEDVQMEEMALPPHDHNLCRKRSVDGTSCAHCAGVFARFFGHSMLSVSKVFDFLLEV